MCAYLTANGPWSQLVALGNISLRTIAPAEEITLSEDLRVTPLPVPHRAEFSDTMAYLARGPARSLFYCPDIDRWEDWTESLPRMLESVDVALLDGTFFSASELRGRNLAEIPHPLVQATAALLAGTSAQIRFIHLNHSNPLFDDSAERRWLEGKGMTIGAAGERFVLRKRLRLWRHLIRIRRAEATDEQTLAHIRRSAILTLAVPALSIEQAERWAAQMTADRFARAIRNREMWVAVEGAVIGWVEVDRDRIAALYVSPSCSRRGVGSPCLHAPKPPYRAWAMQLRVLNPASTHSNSMSAGATFDVDRQMPMEPIRCAKIWPQLGRTKAAS